MILAEALSNLSNPPQPIRDPVQELVNSVKRIRFSELPGKKIDRTYKAYDGLLLRVDDGYCKIGIDPGYHDESPTLCYDDRVTVVELLALDLVTQAQVDDAVEQKRAIAKEQDKATRERQLLFLIQHFGPEKIRELMPKEST